MKAAFLVGVEQVEIRDVPDPVAPEGGLVLDVATCGVCGFRWMEVTTFARKARRRSRWPVIETVTMALGHLNLENTRSLPPLTRSLAVAVKRENN